MATHAKAGRSPVALRDVMSVPVITVGHGATVAEAARIMRQSNVGSVVVTRAQAIAGIFTERDLVRAAAAGVEASRSLVRAWMTAEPFSLPSATSLHDALETLRARKHRRLPVVDEGHLVGIVSLSDFVRAGV
ncbi:MAG TPA: CBS domain-containing protein [Mycobacteriales bacterium]|nr:CBS domain-containing protein [Mycobacteriales bacterium]